MLSEGEDEDENEDKESGGAVTDGYENYHRPRL